MPHRAFPFVLVACVAIDGVLSTGVAIGDEPKFLSHPALRTAPKPPARPRGTGPEFFVDAARGDDTAAGTEPKPWRTIGHAVKQLRPGDTLLLRGGVYFENVSLALTGRADAPITIRGYPGETAILDGGLREFQESPRDAWVPHAATNRDGGGGPGEYRSAKRYPNLRNVVGSFGDSMIGLQTYYYAKDLRSTGETVVWEDEARTDATDIQPLYCGPGMWLDRETGHLHCRLAHTHLPDPVPNYRGETDPRQLPLIIAPFRSIPLMLDHATHLRVQDLVIRGGGYKTVVLDRSENIAFDHVTVWAGTYGFSMNATGPLSITHTAVYGGVAPWTFRGDGSKRDYPGRPHRNISRLNTHALVEIESGGESSVYATPQNDKWEIGWCEFADAHDGVYLGGVNVRFHHNVVENLQDDGLYLSPMYRRHRLEKTDPRIEITHNLFRGLLTAIAYGGTEPVTNDKIILHRNLFDLRAAVNTGRPSAKSPKATFSSGKLMGDHGSPPWPAMFVTHNTVVAAEASRDAEMAAPAANVAGNPRRVFNNLFVHLARLPGYVPPDAAKNSASDANLIWSNQAPAASLEGLFVRYRKSPEFEASLKLHAPGTSTHSRAADPLFVALDADPSQPNDYRLKDGSPAIDAGLDLTGEAGQALGETTLADVLKNDSLGMQDKGKPDLGAIPRGAEFPGVGVDGRVR